MKAARLGGGRTPLPLAHDTRPAVLVVSDDRLVRSVIAPTLRHAGLHVEIADSSARVPTPAHRATFDLVLIGGSLSVDGHVVDRPVPDPPRERAAPRRASDAEAFGLASVIPGARPGSAAERWAALVLRALHSEGDLRTLGEWAAFVGMSQSSLCECCRLVGVRPHEARDLARMLRAVVRSSADGSHPGVLLDVSDRRTLGKLLAKAGIGPGERHASPCDFLQRQQFVHPRNEGLAALRRRLGVT